MATSKVDSKKRIVLPQGQPGDIFDVQQQGEGRYLLVRLEKPEPSRRLTRAECLKAMARTPLRLELSWEELRETTREF